MNQGARDLSEGAERCYLLLALVIGAGMGAEVDIGVTGAGAPVSIDLEELLATRLLVQGNSGSGKSHLLRRLLEQSAGLVQQVVIDPEGDFVGLAERYGHLVVDAEACDAELATIAARVRRHRVSVVLDLQELEVDGQLRAASQFLNALFDCDREFWFPVLVVVDEAQLFAPAAAADASDHARRLSLAAMTNLMCRGRKRGLAGVIATQRLAKLAKNVAAEASNFLMGRTFLDIDMARAADLLGMERRQAEAFRDLQRGCFIGLGPAVARRPLSVRIGSVQTGDRGAAPKLLPLPDSKAGEDIKDLIFAGDPAEPLPAQPRRAPRISADEVLARAEQATPLAYAPAESPALNEEDRERAIDAIVAEMAATPALSTQPLAGLHRDFLARCRIRRLRDGLPDQSMFRRRMTIARARVAFAEEQADEEGWRRAIELSARLPQELQGVFLFLTRAAVTASVCPDDAEIAKFFGSHSPGRARRVLAQLEELGCAVSRDDVQGARIIAFPDLAVETAAGSPPDLPYKHHLQKA